MANNTTGLVWVLDTVGIITQTPVCVQRAVLKPNAASDVADFRYWYQGATDTTYINATTGGATTTTSGTNTITSTGAFTAANVVIGDVIDITSSSSGNNKGRYGVITRSSDNAIVVSGTLTDESDKTYDWKIYNGYQAIYLPAGVSDASGTTIDFGDEGRLFPNLFLYVLTTSAKVYLYLK